MVRRGVTISGALLLSASLGLAQAPSAERVSITDPDRLAALGLPRDAANAFEWTKADAGPVGSRSEKAISATESWGAATGYTTVMGWELGEEPGTSIHNYPDKTDCEMTDAPGVPRQSVAQLQFPDGASLDQLRFWAYDADPSFGLTFNVYEFCQAAGFNPPTTTLVGTADTFGAIGRYYGLAPLHGYRVNNRDCSYSVRVIWAPANEACRGQALQVQKFQISWARQVSAPPAGPTFGDVPTTHPFFQFVEALTKSGITSGCGGGNFCPDQPLTRGQLAVFLAKGLGLAWP